MKSFPSRFPLRNGGVRAKLYIPIFTAILFIMVSSIMLMIVFSMISDSYAVFTRLAASIAALSNNNIKAAIPDGEITVLDSKIFRRNYASLTEDELKYLRNVDYLYGVFEYKPETDRFESTFNNLSDDDEEFRYISGEAKEKLISAGRYWTWNTSGLFPKHSWLYVLEPNTEPGKPLRAVGVGLALEGDYHFLYRYTIPMILLVIIIASAALTVLYFFISKTIRLLVRTSKYVQSITVDHLPDKPLEIHSGDELEYMADTVNTMVLGLKDRNRMESELVAAAAIQTSMLPINFPDNEKYVIHAVMTPAREVGGDFYDFFMADDRHLVVVIADVSGKGVPAAMFMTIGKTLIHDAMSSRISPGEAMSAVNVALHRENENSLFITAWIGVLDLETNILTYTNAGHNPPYIVGDSLHKLEEIHDTVLGIFPTLRYSESSISLKPGEILYLYTDGVNECISADDTFYGTGSLEKELSESRQSSPEALNNRIMAALRTFANGAPQSDDITMLSLMLKPNTTR